MAANAQAVLEALPLAAAARKRMQGATWSAPPLWTPQPGPQARACESEADEILYGGEPGGGKALALDTLLPTPDGWTTMADVEVGDLLLDEQGRPCRVLATSPVMHDHVVYEVEFDDGAVIVADAEHRWLTFSRHERVQVAHRTPEWRARRRATRPPRGTGKKPWLAERNALRAVERATALLAPPTGTVRTTEEIRATLMDGQHVNHSVPLAAPLDLPHDEWLPVAPYALGVWLGDGSSQRADLTCADAEILRHLEGYGYRLTPRAGSDIQYGVGGLHAGLRGLGLLQNKHIPLRYLRASYQQRLALLQGIMDTDGHVNTRGACEITLTREPLMRDVWRLLMTLGIKATVTEGRATLNGRDCGPKWRVKFTTTQPVACLTRKSDRLPTTTRDTTRSRYIVAVRSVPSVPVRCVAVDSPSHLYLASEAMVPTHNTDWLLGMALTRHTRSHIFRRDASQLGEMTDRLREIVGESGRVTESPRPIWRNGAQRIELAGIVNDGDAFKWQGRASDLKAFDELTQFSRMQYLIVSGWGRSTIPGQRVQTIASANPPVDEDALWVVERWRPWLDPGHPNPAQSGEIRWYALLNDEDVEVESGEPFEWEGETVYPSSRTFIRARLADNTYLGSDYRRKIDALPEPMRTILKTSDFLALLQASHPMQVIPTDWVRKAQARWTPDRPHDALEDRPLQQTCVAVDVAEGGRDRTVLARRFGPWVDLLQVTPGALTPDATDTVALAKPHLARGGYCVVDADGVGASVYGMLRSEYEGRVRPFRGVKPTEWQDRAKVLEFLNVRAAAWWNLREALDPESHEQIALPPDDALRVELCAPRWELSGRKIKLEEKKDIIARLGRSPDLADAVVMAFAPPPPLEGYSGQFGQTTRMPAPRPRVGRSGGSHGGRAPALGRRG